MRNGSGPGLSLPLITFVPPVKGAKRQVDKIAACLLCTAPTSTTRSAHLSTPLPARRGLPPGPLLRCPGSWRHGACSVQSGIREAPNPKRPLQDFPQGWSRKWEKSENSEPVRCPVPGTPEATSPRWFRHRRSWSATGSEPGVGY